VIAHETPRAREIAATELEDYDEGHGTLFNLSYTVEQVLGP
jgi:hypothetical protein